MIRRETITADLLKEGWRSASIDLDEHATLAFFQLDNATLRNYPVQLIDAVCRMTDSFRAKK